MREFFAFVFCASMAMFGVEAVAGTQSFCERVAKNFAHANASDVDHWLADYRSSYKDCIAPYEVGLKSDLEKVETTKVASVAVPAVEPAVPSDEPVVTAAPPVIKKAGRKPVRRTQIIPARANDVRRATVLHAPGSIAWNSYCASKYPSFNRLSGTYKGKNGKERRCVETL